MSCQHAVLVESWQPRELTPAGSLSAGASRGIGRETARVLALRGVRVVMAVRDVSAGARAKEAIQAEIRGGAEVDVLQLDLSSMASVGRFAAEFASLNLPLNILM